MEEEHWSNTWKSESDVTNWGGALKQYLKEWINSDDTNGGGALKQYLKQWINSDDTNGGGALKQYLKGGPPRGKRDGVIGHIS